jgi:hypothetical protein
MSIIETSGECALAFFRRDVCRYYGEVVALERDMPPIPRKLLTTTVNPSLFMMVEDYPHGRVAVVCGYEEAFARDCLAWLRGASAKYTLAAFDERVIGLARAENVVGPLRRSRSFVCTSVDGVPALSVAATKLTPADGDAFGRYPVVPSRTRPPLPRLFRDLVLNHGGEIMAIREGVEIVAWLSCMKELENIWDVDFIHVRPERRNCGLGTQVAAAYARDKLLAGDIPYYSGVANNEASERAALKAGFVCCRELFSAEVTE